ncbi:glycine oxidase ThiO [Roseibium sp. SCP14]|uniref:glycine oxidase ThiO n=1 Tax=Roseibium sp. SCP14 TaxID=3141375 RepID=UPI003334C684
MRVLIRGAGVAGLSLAYELRKRGAEVTLFEIREGLTRSASWLAGGMLAPWCERENAEEDVLAYGKKSVDWWAKALPGAVSHKGTLVVAPPRDIAELSRFAGRTSGYEWVDGAGVTGLEPDLEGRFSKGLFFPKEAHLDPRKALIQLEETVSRLGVRTFFGPEEPKVDTNFIADCIGMASKEKELRAVRGEMLILHAPEITLSRPVRMLHPRIPVYIVPRDNNHFMVGATMIESADDGPVSVRSTMELLNAAYSLHPAFAEAKIIETGVGVRPAYADNLPRINFDGRVLSLNGFYRHGFLLAPHFAAQAAETLFLSSKETTLETHH